MNEGLVIFLAIGAAVIVVVRLVNALNATSGSSWTRPRGDAPEDLSEPPKKKRRKKKKKPVDGDATSPRGKHYAFAHKFLRSVTATNPTVWKGVRAAAEKGAIDGILERMWSDMEDAPGEDSGSAPRAEALPDGVLFRMPSPTAMPECYAVVVLEREGSDTPRYFTLEKSLTGAVLCEWADESHVNFGPCETDDAIFVAAARSKIAPPN